MSASKISWFECFGEVRRELFELLESKANYKLPTSYTELIKKCDGGIPLNTDFKYQDYSKDESTTDCIGRFLGFKEDDYNIIREFENKPEFFPDGLLAFAQNGGGDFICFDYRTDSKTDNPSIVFWNHEAGVGQDVSFVAENFEAFLNMLKEPEDELLEEKIN